MNVNETGKENSPKRLAFYLQVHKVNLYSYYTIEEFFFESLELPAGWEKNIFAFQGPILGRLFNVERRIFNIALTLRSREKEN